MVNVFVLALFHTSNDNVLLLHRIGASFGDGLYSMAGKADLDA